jgi:hypothetical protein
MQDALQEPCQFEKMAELRAFSNHARNLTKYAMPQFGEFSQL